MDHFPSLHHTSTNTPIPDVIINHTAVTTFHIILIVTNVVGVLFSISWVIYVWSKLEKIKKQLKRVDVLNTLEINEMRNKVIKYYLYLAVMIIEAIHVLLRLVIYIVFTAFDFLPHEPSQPTCHIIGNYSAYYFIERLQPYQFIWIGLSHSFAIALIISLIVTMLYLRESYSYYERRFKWIKRWLVIGIVQFFAVWVFLSIPYMAPIGSIIFTLSTILDFAFLVKAARRLLAILNMRLFDLKFEPEKYSTFRRSLIKFQWLGIFLLSLMLYLIGIVFAHIAIWLSVSPCFFSTYYNIPYVLTDTQVDTISNVASIVWLLDYVAIFQFDIVLLAGNIIYMIYTRISRKNINDETRQLMNDYSNSLTDYRQRLYTL
ncbi:hypothetical protein LOD99_14130 [Oopsacas minuta]|uniref:G-protein coupled receptors family 1 profile domain-containing protein n=1 Tax=Oopsacas minuta TaxID=111878 RepID=A0AAV7KGL2_9METZ|nr:hypothetical protein LOD99_14130 [Oopsacas minuta]